VQFGKSKLLIFHPNSAGRTAELASLLSPPEVSLVQVNVISSLLASKPGSHCRVQVVPSGDTMDVLAHSGELHCVFGAKPKLFDSTSFKQPAAAMGKHVAATRRDFNSSFSA
jgi:hypothetical protein